eukprot:3886287-Pleurochrysis_carterae.AAC.2
MLQARRMCTNALKQPCLGLLSMMRSGSLCRPGAEDLAWIDVRRPVSSVCWAGRLIESRGARHPHTARLPPSPHAVPWAEPPRRVARRLGRTLCAHHAEAAVACRVWRQTRMEK